MCKGLKILQANLKKFPGVQLNLMNDESLPEFTLLLVMEPSCFRNAEGHNYQQALDGIACKKEYERIPRNRSFRCK